MLKTTLAGMRARTARLVLSSIAIILGVAFVSGTLVLGDATRVSLRDSLAKEARNVDASVTVANGADRNGNPLNKNALDAIRKAPGVAAAEGRESASAPLITAAGKAKSASAIALPTDELLRPFDLAEGRFPRNNNEVALDKRTAATSKYSLGQQVTVLGVDEREHVFTLVGTYQQAVSSGEFSAGDQMILLPDALHTIARDRGYSEIVARAASGVSQQQLVAAIKLTSPELSVITGEQSIAQWLQRIAPAASGFTKFLTAFAVIALIVAAMVIYNTFTILIAQRTRELALLRCVGAGRGQVFGSVVIEAVVMGLFASVLGLFGGLGVSALLQIGIGSFSSRDFDVVVYTPITAKTVLAAFAVGVLVTVIAALLPARKATRVAPVAALRSQSEGSAAVARTGKLRTAVAVVLLLSGVGAAILGGTADEDNGVMFACLGSVLLLGAALALGPILVGPVIGALGAIPRALFGVPAKLASTNAHRNPRRTAATTAALMIGLTVVTTVTVVGASAERSMSSEIDKQFPFDYTISTAVYDRPLSQSLVDQLGAVREVAKVAPRNSFGASVGSTAAQLTAVRGDAVGDLIRPSVISGRLDQLRSGEIALSKQLADQTGFKVGDTVPTSSYRGDRVKQDLKVVAVYDDKGPRLDLGLVDQSTLTKLDPQLTGYQDILVKLKPGVSVADGQAAVEKATSAAPLAEVHSAADTKDQMTRQMNQMLSFIWALIGLAVMIALFGIANTLSLSVLERTKESALLRALGLTRGQLRGMLVIESILMALMGAVIGLALGIGSAWLLVGAMSVALTVPFGQIGALVLAAVVAAVLAATLPARRAARTSIVAGMSEA